MQVKRIGDSSKVTIRVEHEHTIVDYELGINYTGTGALKIRGPIVADVNYEYVTDHIMRTGEFKKKSRPELLELVKREIPATLYLLGE